MTKQTPQYDDTLETITNKNIISISMLFGPIQQTALRKQVCLASINASTVAYIDLKKNGPLTDMNIQIYFS